MIFTFMINKYSTCMEVFKCHVYACICGATIDKACYKWTVHLDTDGTHACLGKRREGSEGGGKRTTLLRESIFQHHHTSFPLECQTHKLF